jgi:hypothetical protein
MLELYEGKLSRTVLRRGNGGNSVPLAGAFWAEVRLCSAPSGWQLGAPSNGASVLPDPRV